MTITKAETLNSVQINIINEKSIRSTYGIIFTDDSTDPDTEGHSQRDTYYVASDTIPSSENQLVKDLAAVLFA
tara:strand:- start:9 stop:227 length:219 start_codon:yes stop_codon:yes gene_type:complete